MSRPIQPAINGTEERLDALVQLITEQNELILAQSALIRMMATPPHTTNLREPAVPDSGSKKQRR